jgi:predicted CXXCH cytochrome family protein
MIEGRPFRFAAPALFLALLLSAVTSLLSAVTSAAAQRRPAAATGPSVTVHLAVQPADQGYVGEERCRACHRAELTEFHKTPHADLRSESGQMMNCESCHGAGKAHSDDEEAAHGDDRLTAAANTLIFAFRGTVQQNIARCLSCHLTSRDQKGFGHSRHAGAAVACQSCHAAHFVEAARREASGAPELPASALSRFFQVPQLGAEQRWLRESLLKESQPALCESCHASARAQFSQPFHHRVPEGSMKCTDCHSVHGSDNRASLNAPGWETCTTCHTDKHGPFVFEHAAVKVEGCAICHTPHGSTSRFMLARRESRFLCLQCHGDPHSEQEQVSVPHSRLGFQARGDCTRCHVTIHGSNASQFFLQ